MNHHHPDTARRLTALRTAIDSLRYEAQPPRLTPLPTVPAMAPAGPSWAVWALGLAILLSLLSTALVTVYARSAERVAAVSDDGGREP